METVTQELYNPHAFIAVRRINSETQENTFPLYKATDIETVLNRINLLEQRIEHQEKQIGQVINNLTLDNWFSDSVEKEEVELAIERNKPDKVMMKRANPGLKQIVELLGTKGITEKDAILAAVRGLVSREISSSSDLTDDEIALIIKHLAVVES